MPKKSKINIFNKIEPEELHDKIKEYLISQILSKINCYEIN